MNRYCLAAGPLSDVLKLVFFSETDPNDEIFWLNLRETERDYVYMPMETYCSRWYYLDGAVGLTGTALFLAEDAGEVALLPVASELDILPFHQAFPGYEDI